MLLTPALKICFVSSVDVNVLFKGFFIAQSSDDFMSILPHEEEIHNLLNSSIKSNPHNLPTTSIAFSVVLLLQESPSHGYDIIDIRKLRTTDVPVYLLSHKETGTHYSEISIGEDEKMCDNYLMCALLMFPDVKKAPPYQNFSWKTTAVVKRECGITKPFMNKHRKDNPYICVIYNGIELWYYPYFQTL